MNSFGMQQQFPRHMYHATEAPIQVTSKEHRDELVAKGYSDTYIHQAWPMTVYHDEMEPKTVANPDELKTALAEGWTVEFEHRTHPSGNPNDTKQMRSPKQRPAPARSSRRGAQSEED